MIADQNKITFFLLSLVFLVSCGCGDGTTPADALAKGNDSNIKRLANLYTKYQSSNNWYGPVDEEDFRSFIENDIPDFIKERIGFTTTDEIFVSERDGQPFKIRYEIQGSARGCDEPAIFEQEGKDGKRIVGFLNMMQKEVEQPEYDDLWAGNYESVQIVPGS